MILNLRNPLAVFDLETTGTDIIKDRIIEISIIKVMPNGDKHVYTQKINPTIPIPQESSDIHRIYDKDVKNMPTFKQVAHKVAQMLKGCDLSGYNILKFDIPLLVEEFLRANIAFEVKNRKMVDVQKIFYLMEPRTLSAAYKFYCGKTLEDAHSAESDALASFEVLNAQIAKYENTSINDKNNQPHQPIKNDMKALSEITMSNLVDLPGKMVYNSQGVPVFNFGKHKNKPVLEVLRKEPQYYDWIMKNDFALHTKKKLTEIKLSEFNQQ